MIKRVLLFITLLLSAFSGVKAQNTLHKIKYMTAWNMQAQFAGYVVAKEKGFYEEVGLDVEILSPTSFTSSIKALGEGGADIVSSILVQAMEAKDWDNIDHINILQTSQVCASVFVTQPHITSFNALDGKRIGVWKSGFDELPMSMVNDNGLSVEWIKFPSGINYFVSGAVDAMITMYYNEFFQVNNCGKKLTDENIYHLADYGYNIPEDGLYCMRSAYLKNRKAFDSFADASKRGWDYAREHREEALEIVLRAMKENNLPTSYSHQKWMLDRILELQVHQDLHKVTYTLDPQAFNSANDILLRNGFIRKALSYDNFIAPK